MKPHLIQRQSRMQVYNISTTPSLLHGYEIWTWKQGDIRRIETEMKSVRPTGGYSSLDHRRTEDILEELEVYRPSRNETSTV
jgi:hypothetical protein